MPYLRDVFLTIASQFEPTTYPTATSLMRLLHLLVFAFPSVATHCELDNNNNNNNNNLYLYSVISTKKPITLYNNNTCKVYGIKI